MSPSGLYTSGHDALREIDGIMGKRPHKDDAALSRAVRRLCEHRQELCAQRRGSGLSARDQQCLSHLNAVISVVIGVHFPLGETPWEELEKARGWLVELTSEAPAASTSPG